MTALVWTVLIASLLGSPHCAGMCGGIAWMAAPGPAPAPGARPAYHGARLAGYLALGTLAGVLGASANVMGSWVGVARAAAIVAGGVMLMLGVITVLRALGVRVPAVQLPATGPMTWVAARARHWPPAARALALGAVTALLPCGWLYAFVAMAAGTGGALSGAAVMAVFWAGTLPAFALLAVAAQRTAGRLRSVLPLVSGGVLIVVGVITMLNRGGVMTHGTPAAPMVMPADADGR